MIVFHSVSWKNFLSTGDTPTKIFLDNSPTTLIIGENGSGKSTVLDALTFGLFGKPFRKINKPQLINTINEKGLLVEISFSIGKKTYLIRRGIKPNIFEIEQNGKLIDQSASNRDYQEYLEKVILKLNYKSFTQIVVLGSSTFEPFMQLKQSDRRAIVEDLLDIQIFSNMNVVLKQKMSDMKTRLQELTYQRELVGEKIRLQKQYIEKLNRDSEDEVKSKQKEIEEILGVKEDKKNHLTVLNTEISDLEGRVIQTDKYQNKFMTLSNLMGKISLKKKMEETDFNFYENNDSCSKCKQDIDKNFKQSRLTELSTSIQEKQNAIEKMSEEVDSIQKMLDNFSKISNTITQKHKEMAKIQEAIFGLDTQVTKLQSQVQTLRESKRTDKTEQKKLNVLVDTDKDLKHQHNELMSEKQMHEYASELLRDSGIKTKIIRQYVPVMNKYVNKFLTDLDFPINFSIDENFNETIKSQYRDEFSYSSLSEGEKMRVDLSLLFTWRMVAKIKNSVNTNLLILDEVFDSSLDSDGTDAFLKIINSQDSKTNVFVISHKGEILYDKFRSTIRFVKEKNFSKIEST